MTKTKNYASLIFTVVGLLAIILLTAVLERTLPATHIVFTVIKKGSIYALVAVSMNLLNGFTGLFSLGQAGFMLIGAYTYAIFTIPEEARKSVYQYFDGGLIHFDLPVLVSLLLAGVAAAIFAFLIGLPVLRLKSDYLAIATLGFAEIVRALAQWKTLGPITNGSNILRKFQNLDSLYLSLGGMRYKISGTMFALVVSGVCIAIIVLLINSTYGRAFKAIRDDEIAAEAMGINLAHHKRLSFCISSFFAGISGALLAMFQTSIQASQFKSAMTYEILLIVVIGGIGSISGSCIGAFLFIACSEWWLRFLDNPTIVNLPWGAYQAPFLRVGFRKVVFSVVIMIMVLFCRRGIMGSKELPEVVMGWFKKKKKKEAKEVSDHE